MSKAQKNVFYYTDCNNNTKLIKENTVLSQDACEIRLTDSEALELSSILEDNESMAQHKCISVYRDAFIYEGDIYNVCLSCGDFYRNNTHHYLSTEGIKKFKQFKCNLIENVIGTNN